MIVDEGSWNETSASKGSTVGVGIAGGGLGIGMADTKTKTQSQGRSKLAEKLQPPQAPPQMSAALIVIGCVCVAIAWFARETLETAIGFGALAGLFFLIEGLTHKSRKTVYLARKSEWQTKINVWARSLLCGRCGALSDPVTGTLSDSDHLRSHLSAAFEIERLKQPRLI